MTKKELRDLMFAYEQIMQFRQKLAMCHPGLVPVLDDSKEPLRAFLVKERRRHEVLSS